jgi:RNA polymerase sigma factor (sigma-70 family)
VDKDDNVLISELAEMCRKGSEAAWSKLIRQITPLIFTICRKANLAREESFDIFGEVSYLLLKNLNRIKSDSKIMSFVATSTWRQIYQEERRIKQAKKSENHIMNALYDNPTRRQDELYEAKEISDIVMEAVTELPHRDFEMIYALFFDSNRPSYDLISRKFDMPVSSIGPTRARCLKRLMKLVQKKGIKRE